jgi:hypothetical protein
MPNYRFRGHIVGHGHVKGQMYHTESDGDLWSIGLVRECIRIWSLRWDK